MPRGRRALALFLTGVLSFEAAFGNGLSLAFAEPLDGGQTIIQTGDDDLQLIAGDSSGAQDPANGGSPSGTEEDTPYDWTNDTKRLELTPGALEIDYEALKALIEDANKDDQTEEDEAPAGDVATDDSVTAQSGDLAPEPELPAQLPAELGLSFTLDPTVSTASPEEDTAETAAEAPGAVEPGDYFTVELPEGLTLDLGDEPVKIFVPDEKGEPTEKVVAEATVTEDGSLKVTFVEQEDEDSSEVSDQTDNEQDQTDNNQDATDNEQTGTENDQTVVDNDQPNQNTDQTGQETDNDQMVDQGDTADEIMTLSGEDAKVAGTLTLGVKLASSAVEGETPSLMWDLGGSNQTLNLPTRSAILEQLGVGEAGAGADGDESGEDSDGDADEPGAPVTTEPGDTVTSSEKPANVVSVSGTTDATLTTIWADNNIAERPAADKLKNGYKLCFTIEGEGGGMFELNADNALTYLGFEDIANYSISLDGTNQTMSYVASCEGLPTEVTTITWEDTGKFDPETGEKIWKAVQDGPKAIRWTIEDNNQYEEPRYLKTEGPGENTQTLQLLNDNTFTITGNIGDEKLDERFDSEVENKHLKVEIITGGNEDSKASVDLGDLLNSTDPTKPGDRDANGLTASWDATTGQLVINGPAYSKDNAPIEYRLVHVSPEDEDKSDYYDVLYNNEDVDNHGQDVSATYPGGKLTFVHKGTTDFTAYMEWRDNEEKADDTRGEEWKISFTLWRYSAHGGSAQSASQVSSGGQFAYVTLTADEATQYVDEDNPKAFDIGKLIDAKYPDLVLEKYDPAGYPYIYAMRQESTPTGYELVYGKIEDGKLKDTAPNYANVEGNADVFPNKDWGRPAGNDPLVYNGGYIGNKLTGTVHVEQVKEWKVAAFADQLKDVTCTFQLQRKDENDAWIDVTDETQTLDGFSAEKLTGTVSGDYPKYDDEGQEIEYRWVETGLTQGGEEIEFTPNTEPKPEGQDYEVLASFKLDLQATEGSTDADDTKSYAFRSILTEDGTIENVFSDTTEEHVTKIWNKNDFKDDLPGITLTIYRDGVAVGTVTMNGTAGKRDVAWDESVKSEFTGTEVKESTEEDGSWLLDITGLPAYSEDGKRHSYRIFESSIEGNEDGEWVADRDYDATSNTTTLTNTYGAGEGTAFHLTKSWIDDADSSHHLPCLVEVKAKRELKDTKGTVYEEGYVFYGAGAGADGEDNYLELSDDNQWFAGFMIPVNGVTFDDLVVEEAYLLGTDGTTKYPVMSREEAEEYYQGQKAPEWVNAGWDFDDGYINNAKFDRVATDDHVYEVEIRTSGEETDSDNNPVYEKDDGPYGKPMYTITNRRIGLVDITIDKTWVDEGADVNDRPKATYILACDDDEAYFSANAEGDVLITLGDGDIVDANSLPIFADEGSKTRISITTGAKLLNIDGEEVQGDEEAVKLSIPVNTTNDKSSAYFYGLPKYNGAGEVVHYTVTESMPQNDDGYVSSIRSTVISGAEAGDDGYEVGEWHFHDRQGYKATNTRTGSAEVSFYKQWVDAYGYETDQRPDIHLKLYKKSADTGDKLTKVTGYIRYLWKSKNETATQDTDLTKGEYLQECVVTLPKYDSKGGEIAYYAVEVSDTNGVDYQPVRFEFSEGDYTHGDEAGDKLYLIGESGAEPVANDAVSEASGEDYAMRSGGTFVNEVANAVSFNGTKRWNNTEGMLAEHTPDVLLVLQRRLRWAESWPEVKIEQNAEEKWVPGGAGDKQTAEGSNGWIAYTDELKSKSATEYTFTLSSGEEGSSFPKYNEKGELYEYRVIEAIVGLIGTDGGVTAEKAAELNIADDKQREQLNGGVYDFAAAGQGSLVINNTYNPDKTDLTVAKKLVGEFNDGDEFPEVTFTLYRYAEGAEASTAKAIATGVIGSEENPFKGSDDEGGRTSQESGTDLELSGGSGDMPEATPGSSEITGAYTFKDLDIYDPFGNRWNYFVVEDAVNGYPDVKVSVADGEFAAAKAWPDENSKTGYATGTLTLKEDVEGQENKSGQVTFQNSYDPNAGGTLTLTGSKTWNDGENLDGKGTRPGELDLTLTRHTDKIAKETVKLNEADGPKLTWDEDKWTFTITGLEQWASDSDPWIYTISEKSDDQEKKLFDAGYRIDTGEVSATGKETEDAAEDGVGYEGEFKPLVNSLAGKVTVTKTWEDGGNLWDQRPTGLKVQLQVRKKDSVPEAQWKSAETNDAVKAALDKYKKSSEPTLTGSGNKWSYTWDYLPTVVPGANGGDPNVKLEYRVIETAFVVNGKDITLGTPSIDSSDPTKLSYATTLSYTGSQTIERKTDTTTNEQLATNAITNSLKEGDYTAIKVTKTWSDEDNKWNLRDTVFDTGTGERVWYVDFYLQRTTDANPENASWEFVSKNDGSGYVTARLTGALSGEGVDVASTEFNYLPAKNENGDKYTYRVVEIVPDGYTPSGTDGADVAATEEGLEDKTLFVVSSTDEGGQSFTNTLDTLKFSGTKSWEDYETNLKPDSPTTDEVPTLKLQRSTSPNDATPTWEDVTCTDGEGKKVSPDPKWGTGQDGSWTWEYTGLPQVDRDGKPYTYRVVEDPYPGFHGEPGTSTGTVTKEQNGDGYADQTGSELKNVVNRLAFSKVSESGSTALKNVELAVVDLNDDGETINAVHAIWHCDESGNVQTYSWRTDEEAKNAASTLWTGGNNWKTDKADPGKSESAKTPDGQKSYIVGLPAGEYTVIETGDMGDVTGGSTAHARIKPFEITVNDNGTVEVAKGSTGVTVGKEGTTEVPLVTVTDPIFRGHFEFTKQLEGSTKGLSGASFSLYKMKEDGNGNWVKDGEAIATGLTTDDYGTFNSHDDAEGIEFSTQLDSEHIELSDGLIPGTYCLVETSAPDSAYLPSDESARTYRFTIGPEEHYYGEDDAVKVGTEGVITNTPFNARVSITKTDATSGEPIKDAVFKLERQTIGADDVETWTVVEGQQNLESNEDGKVVATITSKGTYRLVEVSNTGYVVDEDALPTVEFTVENGDHQDDADAEPYDLLASESAEKFDVETSNFTEKNDSIPNERLLGTVVLKKQNEDSEPLDGVNFNLFRLDADGNTWEKVGEELYTGYGFVYTESGNYWNDPKLGQHGELKVSGLPWGTYQFVEVGALPGYEQVDKDGNELKSIEFVVNRESVAQGEIVVGTLTNILTELTLKKVDEEGEALAGATFTIKPASGHTFFDNTSEPKEFTVDSNGVATITGVLVAGATYTLTETEAPEGYECVEGGLTFAVQPDGTIKCEGACPAGFVVGDDGVSVTATDQLIEVQLKKVDNDGYPLSGAKFKLFSMDEDGNVLEEGATEYTSDTYGLIKFSGLIGDRTYVLRETDAPEGYKPLGDLTFKLDAHGKVDFVGEAAGYAVSNDEGVATITATDDPIAVTLQKRDLGTTTLKGATFEIGGCFVNDVTHVVDAAEQTLEFTMNSGSMALTGLAATAGDGNTYSLAAGQTYKLTEVTAPEGYKKIGSSFSFTVKEDGTIELAPGVTEAEPGKPGYVLGNDGMTIVAHDEPYKIVLEKHNQSGEALAGATFVVRPADGSHFAGGGTTSMQVTTGSDGTVTFSGSLALGQSYEIEETAAPGGYQRIPGTFEFKMNDDGTIAATDTSVGDDVWRTPGYYVADGGLTLVAVNELRPGGGGTPGDPDDKPDPDEPGVDEPDPDDPTDPDDPDNPDNPEDPDDPDSPDNPDDPEGPDDPGNPDDPGTPDDPSDPGDPDTPGDPSDPDDPGTPGHPGTTVIPGTPDAGDHTNAALPGIVAMAGAALVACAAALLRRRGANNR